VFLLLNIAPAFRRILVISWRLRCARDVKVAAVKAGSLAYWWSPSKRLWASLLFQLGLKCLLDSLLK